MNETVPEMIINWTGPIMNYAQFTISLLLVVLVAACFLGRYVVLTRKLVLSSLGIVVLCALCSVIVNVFFSDMAEEDIMPFDLALNFAMDIYAFVFYLLAFKEKRFLRAVESLICYNLLTLYISTFSQMAVIYLVGGTDEVTVEIFEASLGTGPLWFAISGTGLIITTAILVIIYLGFYRPKKYFVIGIPYRILFIIWILIFVVFPYIPAVIPSDEFTIDERYYVMSVMFGIGIIILGLAMPVIVVIATAERSMREKNKAQESYLSAELEYIGQYKRKQVETRAFRHDINNNLGMALMMLEEGHAEDAKKHISDMLGHIRSLSPKYVTGDEMLDIIISMKADKMDERNIRFTLDGVTDGGLNTKPMDMCSIFANALDNAIEAASACEDPFITFSIKRTDRYFIIKITNSASSKVDVGKLLSSSGYTSKKDKDHHGFGLMNVRRSVEDCSGILKAESDDKSFTLSIMMPRTLPSSV
ncbi:MAG: sensor histidine kinase [Lachnospiraceae bacterium]|nr:sensor histidine kinase [Lachnospiraceae bacterium]